MALRNRCTKKLRGSPKLIAKTDTMPAPAVFDPQPSHLGQLNGLSVTSGESTPLSTLDNRRNLNLRMTLLDGIYGICRVEGSVGSRAGVADWVDGPFWSATHTQEELSIVCLQELIPDQVLYEGDWRVLKVLGPLSFSLTGILAAISSVLAEAGVSIFSVSTYNTDYILVKYDRLEDAMEALTGRGVEFI